MWARTFLHHGIMGCDVRWGLAGNLVWAWIFTRPASAFVAAVFYLKSLLLF